MMRAEPSKPSTSTGRCPSAAPRAGRRGAWRAAARRAGAAQREREPLPAERGGGGRDRRGVLRSASVDEPLPRARCLALRADLARYLGHGLTADQVWAANGSNEVMLHVLQAFAGPGRTVLSFAPTYSMYPEYARDTHSTWRTAPAATTSRSTRTRRGRLSPSTGRTWCSWPARTTRPARRSTWTPSPRWPTSRRGWWWSTRRTTSSPGTARPARSSCCRRTPARGDPDDVQAFAFAGGRLGYLAATPAFVDALRIVRLPYHLSAVTQAVARVALAHAEEMLAAVDRLRRPRRLADWLRAPGWRSPSPTPTSLFGRFADRHAVWRGCWTAGADPRGRAGGLAAGLGGDPGGDDGVQTGAGRRARGEAMKYKGATPWDPRRDRNDTREVAR